MLGILVGPGGSLLLLAPAHALPVRSSVVLVGPVQLALHRGIGIGLRHGV